MDELGAEGGGVIQALRSFAPRAGRTVTEFRPQVFRLFSRPRRRPTGTRTDTMTPANDNGPIQADDFTDPWRPPCWLANTMPDLPILLVQLRAADV